MSKLERDYRGRGEKRAFEIEISLHPGKGGESPLGGESVMLALIDIMHTGTTETRMKFARELELALQKVCDDNGAQMNINR